MQEMLKDMNAEDRDRIMAQFNDQMRQMGNRRSDERSEAEDRMKAKLAAKKRMKEELDKERAVNKELNHITKTHVSQHAAWNVAHLPTFWNLQLPPYWPMTAIVT